MPPETGRRVGRYVLEAELGRGGMGVVYRARDPEGREVALKALAGTKAEHAAAFEREVRLLRDFSEAEGFVPVLDAGQEGGRSFLVMPLLEGGSLADRIARGPLAVVEALEIGRRLARALACAHERGIVHRDVKPENVLFRDASRPLLADLGLAKHFRQDVMGASQSRALTGTGTFKGTSGYMAPEQSEDARSVGPACDVFSLGVVLYESLAGTLPYRGDGLLAYLDAMKRRARPLRTFRADVPRFFEAAIARAIEPERSRRFSDGRAFLEALEAPPGVGRAVPFAVALLVLVVVASGAFALARRRPEATPPKRHLVPERHELAPARPELAPVPTSRAPAFAALLARAKAEREAGQLDRALADVALAYVAAPDDQDVKVERNLIVNAKSDPTFAIEELGRLVGREPGNARAWCERGYLRGKAGDLEGEISDEARATGLDPRLVTAWACAAYARIARSEWAEARADASRTLELDPLNETARIFRVQARLELHDYGGAIADATRALEITKEAHRPSVFALRGNARAAYGDLGGATSDLERAAGTLSASGKALLAELREKQTSFDHDAAARLADSAVASLSKGDLESTIRLANEAIAADPRVTKALYARATARSLIGTDWDGVIADATRTLDDVAGDPMLWGLRAEARLKTGDLDGGLADLDRATSLPGARDQIFSMRASARLDKGDVVGARADAERCLAMTPADGLVRQRIEELLAKIAARSH